MIANGSCVLGSLHWVMAVQAAVIVKTGMPPLIAQRLRLTHIAVEADALYRYEAAVEVLVGRRLGHVAAFVMRGSTVVFSRSYRIAASGASPVVGSANDRTVD